MHWHLVVDVSHGTDLQGFAEKPIHWRQEDFRIHSSRFLNSLRCTIDMSAGYRALDPGQKHTQTHSLYSLLYCHNSY